MRSIKENRGITLIALAVTIIVILILAGVTIDAVFSENGIINKAKEAANSMNNAVANDQAELNDLLEELNEIMNSEWNNNIEIPEENTIPEPDPEEPVYTEDGVLVPEGFYYVGGKKEEGIVISDNAQDENKGTSHETAKTLRGNQFVWVPVEDINEFKRYEGYLDGRLDEKLSSCIEPNLSSGDIEKSEYEAMYSSVRENKGFYIARYEAGTGSNIERNENSGIEDEVVSKQGYIVYDYIGWSNSNDITNQNGGAVQKAREMYSGKEEYGVNSTLCYGVQWDATMSFIDPEFKTGNCGSYSFVVNSNNKGCYNTNKSSVTGASESYKTKNIYDLGGNVFEWTMESDNQGNNRIMRGGSYGVSGSKYPASTRSLWFPSYKNIGRGFRVALYIP